jgi:hypothetical protein
MTMRTLQEEYTVVAPAEDAVRQAAMDALSLAIQAEKAAHKSWSLTKRPEKKEAAWNAYKAAQARRACSCVTFSAAQAVAHVVRGVVRELRVQRVQEDRAAPLVLRHVARLARARRQPQDPPERQLGLRIPHASTCEKS